jgi:two-component system, OmpR family, phosphate regulon sensor histidine kinase PhoR
LESAKPPAEPDRIPVRAALDSVLRIIEPEAMEREIKLVCGNIDDAEVSGYRVHFEQAVLNLLQNAVKFNRAGGEVRLSASCVNGKVCIQVSDTGVGIPSEDLSRIFERFYRVDRARSREVGGTGLGLSIVKHIVERMHGTVAVESQLGKGSEFRIYLPALLK